MSLSLISGKLGFLCDGYIASIEHCCVSMIVKCTFFAMCIASLLLDASSKMIFAMYVTSLLLKRHSTQSCTIATNFMLEYYSYYTIKMPKHVTVE